MAQDAFGNYQATISPPPQPPSDSGPWLRRQGAPDANTPLWALGYIDKSTGDVYVNIDGTPTGWVMITAGISGVSGVYAYDGNPNGNVTATGRGVCIGMGSTEGAIWGKTSAGTSNNEWFEMVASPNG